MMRGLSDDLGEVMLMRKRHHRRVDRMSRVFGAGRLTDVSGKGSADDYKGEYECRQASTHLTQVYRTGIRTSPSSDEFLH